MKKGWTTGFHVAIWIVFFTGASLLAFSSLSARKQESCVTCHTDAAKLKSLFVPQKLKFQTVEGEG